MCFSHKSFLYCSFSRNAKTTTGLFDDEDEDDLFGTSSKPPEPAKSTPSNKVKKLTIVYVIECQYRFNAFLFHEENNLKTVFVNVTEFLIVNLIS